MQRKAIQETEQRVKALFDELCGGEPAMTWRTAEGEPKSLIAEMARSADLVISTGERARTGCGYRACRGLVDLGRRARAGAAAEL